MNRRIVNLRRQESRVTRRKLVRYTSYSSASDFPIPNLHDRMFNEDVAIGLMPAFARSRSNFQVRLDPADPTREAAVSLALDGGAERDLAGGLTRFLQKTIGEILDTGRCAYEVAYLAENENAPPTNFELLHVNASQLVLQNDTFVQRIPPDIAKRHRFPAEIVIPQTDVLMLSLPPDLTTTVRKVKTSLARIGAPEYLKFIAEAQAQNLPYDFTAHERVKQLALAEAGRLVGWTARGSFNHEVLSYYWIRLQLNFETFKLRIREHLLTQLNATLRHAGARIGFTAEIRVEGLPTLADIALAQDQLAAGNMAFTEVMKPFSR